MRWFRGSSQAREQLSAVRESNQPISRFWESPLTEVDYFVIDIETSGFSAETDIILSLAAGCVTGTEENFSDFIYHLIQHDDVCSVPQQIWKLTGLSPEHLRSGRDLREVIKDVLTLAVNRVWIAHHARHELSFLQHHARQLWKMKLRPIVIDTAVVAQALGRLPSAPTLDEVCQWLNVTDKGRHQADSDVRMTAEVWRKEIGLCQKIGLKTVTEVIDWASSRAMG